MFPPEFPVLKLGKCRGGTPAEEDPGSMTSDPGYSLGFSQWVSVFTDTMMSWLLSAYLSITHTSQRFRAWVVRIFFREIPGSSIIPSFLDNQGQG